MHRRTYLATIGGAALAGCTSSNDPAGTGGGGQTPTESLTPTSTPTPKPPSIESVSLLSRWEQFGDVLDRTVDAVGQGAPAIIGVRWKSGGYDGQTDVTEQVTVYDESGARVAIDEVSDSQLVDTSGYRSWEHALSFETGEWSLGNYETEVIIRDNVLGANSNGSTATFEVTEPLSGSEAALASVDAPMTISIDKRYEFELTLENESTRDGSVVSPVSIRYESKDEWYTYDFSVKSTMAQGRTNTWSGWLSDFSYEGTATIRLDDINETWTVDVTA